MKVTINVDLTPEEMRRLVGLPDVEQFNKDLLEEIKQKMTAGVEGYDPLSLFQPYMNSAAMGMDMFSKMMSTAMGAKPKGGDG